MISAMKNCH